VHRIGPVLFTAHVNVCTAFFHDEQTQRGERDEGQENFPHGSDPKNESLQKDRGTPQAVCPDRLTNNDQSLA
jgi:hypothetical protein